MSSRRIRNAHNYVCELRKYLRFNKRINSSSNT